MILLAVDTSDRQGSIALLRCEAASGCELLQSVQLSGGAFSAQLVPEIAALLQRGGFERHDIEAFVVASGPGSFTGLRIGLAAVKGLGEALQKPIAAVSLLQSVAESSSVKGRVIAILDAGRGELYVGEFDVLAGTTSVLGERLLKRDDLAGLARNAVVVCPDNMALGEFGEGLDVRMIPRPSILEIARLGWKKILDGELVSPADLDTNYVRRSDQDLFVRGGS